MAQQQTTDVVVARGDMFHSQTARRHNSHKKEQHHPHIHKTRRHKCDDTRQEKNDTSKKTRTEKGTKRAKAQQKKYTTERKHERKNRTKRAKEEEGEAKVQNKPCQITTNTGNTSPRHNISNTNITHDNNDVITTTPRRDHQERCKHHKSNNTATKQQQQRAQWHSNRQRMLWLRAAICYTYSLQDDTTATRKSNIIHKHKTQQTQVWRHTPRKK